MKEGWIYKKLGDIGKFQRGGGFLKNDFIDEGFPCIHYGQIHTKFGVCVEKHLTCISKEIASKSKIAHPNDLIIVITSEDVEGSCKCTAWLGNYDVAVGAHAAIYRHNQNAKYLAYVLRSRRFNEDKTKYAHGFKVVEIKPDDIGKIEVPIAPLSLQQQIVSELDLLSDVIEKQKAQIEELDKLAQSAFYDMFGDPVTNEKSWEIKQLGDVSDITSSKRIFANEYREDGIPFYRGKEITEKSKGQEISLELFISEERYEEIKKSFGVPSIGDILITAVGTIGNIWVVNDTNPFYFKDGNIIWVKEFKNIDPTYFKSVLTILIATYKSEMANGCAYNALTIVNLKKMSFALPPLALQQEFAAKVEAIEQMKAKVRQSLKESEELFNSRMDYYFD